MKKLISIMLMLVIFVCVTGCAGRSNSNEDSSDIKELRTHNLDLDSKKGKKEFLKVLKAELREDSESSQSERMWDLEYIKELREDEEAWEEFKDSADEILDENDDIETIGDFVDAYIENSRQSADVDTLEEIVTAIRTVYSEKDNYDLPRKEEIVLNMDGLFINNDALKEALDNLGISERLKLKSKRWGDVTIKVNSKGECDVASDGELNMAGYYK